MGYCVDGEMTLTEQLKKLGAQVGDLAILETAVGIVLFIDDQGNYRIELLEDYIYSNVNDERFGKLISLIRPPPEFWKPETWTWGWVDLHWEDRDGRCPHKAFQKLQLPPEDEYQEVVVKIKKGQVIRVVNITDKYE